MGHCRQFEPIHQRRDEWRHALKRRKSSKVSDAAIKETPAPRAEKPAGSSVLRLFLLLLTAAQMLFIVFLTVFIARRMNPTGDGMEFVAVSAAIVLLEIPFTIPAFILAVRDKALGVAACLAGFASFAYVIFWIQVYAEMTAKASS
jgi:hypothetical protein